MSSFGRSVWGALAFLPLAAVAETTYLCPENGKTIQQLRVYELVRDNRDAFHARFHDHALRIMKKYGFDVVDAWESDIGEKLQLIYVLSWPDRETMESRWKAFLADQEWIDIKARSAARDGALVNSAVGQPLARLAYSPQCARK